MKHHKRHQSSKCISTVVLLNAASARKMDNKDDEAEEPEKREKQQKPTPEQTRDQNLAPNSSSLSAQDTRVDESDTVEQRIEPPQNEDRESAQSSHENVRHDTQDSPHSEERGHTSNLKSRQPRPQIHIKDISDIPDESAESLASSRVASKSSKTSRSSRPQLPSHGTESIEGEFEIGEQEDMGPTLGQYRYQMTREDYETLSKSLQEKTIRTLLHLGEIHKSAYVDSKPPTTKPPLAPRLSEDTAETQLFALDKELKSIARRINESKREQAYTLQRINNLEVTMLKKQEADYLREIMTKIPNEEDLKAMEQIRQLMLERKRLQKEIDKLNMEMSSMNKAMANADVIISDCAAIKKPRRVVICSRTQNQPIAREESSSREAIGRESPTKEGTPHTADASDLMSATVSGGSIEGPEEQAEQSNVPETTESDDVGGDTAEKGK